MKPGQTVWTKHKQDNLRICHEVDTSIKEFGFFRSSHRFNYILSRVTLIWRVFLDEGSDNISRQIIQNRFDQEKKQEKLVKL